MRWVILAMAGVACSRVHDARSAAEAMRSAACGGDVVAFFGHVDRTSLRHHLQAAAAEKVIPQVAQQFGVPEYVVAESLKSRQAGLDDSASTAFQRVMTQWEDDIKKGKSGGLCSVSFLSDWTKDATGEVWIRYQNGYEWVWLFTRFGEKTWMLTELLPPEKRR